jgi:hypothetical protein
MFKYEIKIIILLCAFSDGTTRLELGVDYVWTCTMCRYVVYAKPAVHHFKLSITVLSVQIPTSKLRLHQKAIIIINRTEQTRRLKDQGSSTARPARR